MERSFKSNKEDARKQKVWMPLGRLPQRFLYVSEDNQVKRINRYIGYMERRLKRLADAEEFDKCVWIWKVLLKNSLAYQIVLYVNTGREYYWKYSRSRVIAEMATWVRKARSFNLDMYLKRIYLTKPNGKLRPIGSPTRVSKCIAKAITHISMIVLDGSFHENQHAYRPHKGVHTALEVAIKRILSDHKVFQFDLSSFFNSMDMKYVFRMVEFKISKSFANLIATAVKVTGMSFFHWYPEKEYEHPSKYMNQSGGSWNKYTILKRNGMPQGLSFSPILSTFVLEHNWIPESLLLYADDGLYFHKGDSRKEFWSWTTAMAHFGVELKDEGTGPCENEFTFLGVKFSIQDKTVEYEGRKKSMLDKDIKEFLQQVEGKYGKQSAGWTWEMNPESFAMAHRQGWVTGDWWIRLKTMWYGERKGYKYVPYFGIFNISRLSSSCCVDLIAETKRLNLGKKKRLPELPYHGDLDCGWAIINRWIT